MINRNLNPLAYALLLHELTEAQEHLASLINEMSNSGTIDEMSFCVELAHIYSHLNRSWNGRHSDDINDEEWEQNSKFPEDIILNFL